ncbi:MAG: hypothetical protein V3T08_09910 [Gemmatimonadota bacterium]
MSGTYGQVGSVKDVQVDLALDGEESAVVLSAFRDRTELTATEARRLARLLRDAARQLDRANYSPAHAPDTCFVCDQRRRRRALR